MGDTIGIFHYIDKNYKMMWQDKIYGTFIS